MAKRSAKLPLIQIPSAKLDDQLVTRGMLKATSDQLRAEMGQNHFDVKKDLAEVKVMVHQACVFVEEQNANNRVVLEGLQALWQRQDLFEKASTTKR